MGCWNETCGISNLHITNDSEIYVFPIQETGLGAGQRVYSHCVWSPIPLPFEGHYNDYGGVYQVSDSFELIQDYLKSNALNVPLGENKYHDIAVDPSQMDLELFNSAIHESRLIGPNVYERYGKDNLPKTVLISRMFVRKDILDVMLDKMPCEVWDNGFKTLTWEDFQKGLPSFTQEFFRRIKSSDPEYFFIGELAFKFDGFDSLTAMVAKVLSHSFSSSSSASQATAFRRYSDSIFRAIRKGEIADDKAIELLGKLFFGAGLTVFVDSILSASRKMWHPQCGAGSQQDDYEVYEALMEAMRFAIHTEKQENGYDEEE